MRIRYLWEKWRRSRVEVFPDDPGCCLNFATMCECFIFQISSSVLKDALLGFESRIPSSSCSWKLQQRATEMLRNQSWPRVRHTIGESIFLRILCNLDEQQLFHLNGITISLTFSLNAAKDLNRARAAASEGTHFGLDCWN